MKLLIRSIRNVLRSPLRLVLVVALLGTSLMFVAAMTSLSTSAQQELATVHKQVGTAITIVIMPKKAFTSAPEPIVKKWCSHTINDKKVIAPSAHTIDMYPNSRLREKVATTSENPGESDTSLHRWKAEDRFDYWSKRPTTKRSRAR